MISKWESQQFYREKNKRLRKFKLRDWRRKNPDMVSITKRRNNYHSKYGITPIRADEMLKSQGNVCAICKLPIKLGGKTGAKIDHCHKTNIVRGILCSRCNLGLGQFKDDISNLCEAIKYLSLNTNNVIIVNAS